MARVTVTRFKERFKKAKSEFDLNRSLYEDAYEYIMPFRNTFNRTDKTHNRPTVQYSSDQMISAVNFINSLQQDFTPMFTRWSELQAGPAILDEELRMQTNEAFQEINETLTSYRNASNFTLATAEMYWDLGMGTGIMFILEGSEEQPINYVTTPLSKVAIEDGRFGEVSGLYREHEVKGSLIKAQWPSVVLPGELIKDIADKPDGIVNLIEGFYFDYEELKWYQDLITVKDDHRILEKEFAEAPFVAPRWMKIPGIATGVGPFVFAMADYKTLNKMTEYMLQLAALNIFGVYTVASNAPFNPNTADIHPGAFIPVERNETRNPSIAALPRAGDYQVQEFMMSGLRDQIRQTMLDNRLPPDSQPVKSAFEISERIKELQSNTGVSFGRLYFEFVLPLHKRELSILSRKGKITLPPNFTIDNFSVKVAVLSPIAFQQNLDDVNRFMQTFQMASAVSPEVAQMVYEIEKIPRWLNEKMGIPAKLLRDDVQFNEIKEKLAGMMQQGIEAQQQQAAG